MACVSLSPGASRGHVESDWRATMEPSVLLDNTTVYIGRWSSGRTYVTVYGNDFRPHGRWDVAMTFGEGCDLGDVIDCVARVLVGWAELGALGACLTHEYIQSEGLCG